MCLLSSMFTLSSSHIKPWIFWHQNVRKDTNNKQSNVIKRDYRCIFNIFSLGYPCSVEETRKGMSEGTWSFHLRHYSLWIFSRTRFPENDEVPNEVIPHIYMPVALHWIGFLDKSTTPSLSLSTTGAESESACRNVDIAIKPLSLHQTCLHIRSWSLMWSCIHVVSSKSMKLLHCWFWSSIRLSTFECESNLQSSSQCNRLRLKFRSGGIGCHYYGSFVHAW